MGDFMKNIVIPAISVLTAVFVGISNYHISQLKTDVDAVVSNYSNGSFQSGKGAHSMSCIPLY